MKVLEVLTYYRPHISGLTIYVERLSKALNRAGHQVTVFTSRYDPSLPLREKMDGVSIVRVPVAFRVSKGVIMPKFGPMAWGMVRESDIIHLHLPQFDAPGVAFRGRLMGKPVVLTYHSDLMLPNGSLNRVAESVIAIMNRLAGRLSDAVVTYTYDFGSHSPFLSRYLDEKLIVIPPPVELPQASRNEVDLFQERYDLGGKKVIGISARMAAEKGIEVLLQAMPIVLREHPDAHVIHANPAAIGEAAYEESLRPLLERYRDNYHLLGPLYGSELTAFYRSLDCLVMCSLNNTETFGLVQIEAMINGAPAVSSDLPGVRQPVALTGMGEVAPVGDPRALAAAIIKVLGNKSSYMRSPEVIADAFDPDHTAAEYIRLFTSLLEGHTLGRTVEPASYQALRDLRDSFASLEMD